ncbi:MAG: PEP/pyruvate-binding domain-containing protein [Desulfobacteraceae bacterium]|jgi:CheY-like chemotaxis protein
MSPEFDRIVDQFDPRFKKFHELMKHKVREILLVSSPYNAWIMEEDCRLSEAIVNEYRGLNLSQPPRLHWVASTAATESILKKRPYDLVIIMPQTPEDPSSALLAAKIRQTAPHLPIIRLCHRAPAHFDMLSGTQGKLTFDRTFVWNGDSNLLLALIKSVEDRHNVDDDTRCAAIRVIIFVDDSPEYVSVLLPLLYRELVAQTQAVIGEGLNEDHRLLAMRARPKILIADCYEQAVALFQRYEPYVLGVISDVRYPRADKPCATAGIELLKHIKRQRFDIPLLLLSNESRNREKAARIPAVFIDKNASTLLSEVRSFFLNHLGFGPFSFLMPNGEKIATAATLRALEKQLHQIPAESFAHHCNCNDFSRWLFARGEIELAQRLRPVRDSDFEDVESHRRHMIDLIHKRRLDRQKGIVVNFDARAFDTDSELLKIGNGSLGGKARGLAFFSAWLYRRPDLTEDFPQIEIAVPRTLVITTEVFEEFMAVNRLEEVVNETIPDEEVARIFRSAKFPRRTRAQLRAFLSSATDPLAVRSSSLLEDAQFRAYAGLYKTFMLANDHEDPRCRLDQLIDAIKMVYASTYFQAPRSFSKRVGNRIEEEKMAIIIQRIVGDRQGYFFYPAVSGVAQSHNYYPFSRMTPEDGIATIALGLGKAVMEGGQSLRFSPRHPSLLPQRSTVDDILQNCQRRFYAVKMGAPVCRLGTDDSTTLVQREIMDAANEYPVMQLAGTYDANEHRIRESSRSQGLRVLTFAALLKFDLFPLAGILERLLALGQQGMGCPVEMEFCIDLPSKQDRKPSLAVLQIRPMGAREELTPVQITSGDTATAFCISHQALGNTVNSQMRDVVYVKPDLFDPAGSREVARQIAKINAALTAGGRKFILIGPGRWGSADPWLGIPVGWDDICGVGAIVETTHPRIHAEPSQGSHFFHNITSLGINYMNVGQHPSDLLDRRWIEALPVATATENVLHLANPRPVTLKVDGRRSQGVILKTRKG